MTSQTTKMEELKAEAKALGIKGAHFFKSEESLQDKIDSVKTVEPVVEQPKRKPAPKMSVAGILTDDRAALVERLEKEDPDCKYIFQSGDISDRELAAKGLERTEYSLKNDILCRTDRESYIKVQDAKRQAQYDSMQRIDGGKGIIDNHTETPKVPRGS